MRCVRIANLPPEVKDETLRDTLSTYSEVKGISIYLWSRAYRYRVSNGTRIVEISLRQHIPSHMTIAGYRALISYDVSQQPVTAVMRLAIITTSALTRKRRHHPKSVSIESRANVVAQGPKRDRHIQITHDQVDEKGDTTEVNNIEDTDAIDKHKPGGNR